MSNLELRIEEEASLNLTLGESSDMSFDAVDFVGVPFAPTVEVEDIEGGHRVSITSMGAEGKKTDEFDVMDGADGATGPQGPKGDSYEITSADYAAIAEVVEEDIQDVINAAQDATADATAAAAEARAASAATWLSGNVLFGELAEGTVLTTDDAFAAPPKGVSVYGKSTQDGTPTPDAPVEIKSVDDLTLWLCGKNLLDYEAFKDIANWDTSALYMAFPISVPSGVSLVAHYDGTAIASSDVTMDFLAAKGSSASNYLIHANYPNTTRTVATTNGVVYLNAYPKTQATIDTILELLNGRYLRVELGTATAYTPYVGQSVEIPLDNNVGRSLPDGTRDTLTLSYVGPSTEHEGWGVFGASLKQSVDTLTLDGTQALSLVDWRTSETSVGFAYASSTLPITSNALMSDKLSVCTYDDLYYSRVDSGMVHNIYATAYSLFVRVPYPELTTRALVNAWLAENPITVVYPLATPITTDLGTIELPILPNPLTAWADGGSAQPTMQLEYERALSIVIPRIEAAISDLATS